MLYDIYEAARRLMLPATLGAQAASRVFSADGSWLSLFPGAKSLAAGFELFHRVGKDYEKPEFNIHSVEKDGMSIPVVEQEISRTAFCRLLRFKRYSDDASSVQDLKSEPSVLVVAPLSGHHATLLRDTVQTLLQDHKVYITDWVDARTVPLESGAFGLDDYVKTIEAFIRKIGADRLHVVAVCQPVVPVLGAVALMSARGEAVPRSMILMGGPVDARQSPTSVNNLASRHPYQWFEKNLIHRVPQGYAGAGRRVYPGFLQHMGFVAMNPERHMMSHWEFFEDLVRGEHEDAASHRKFYDEYNAVLDMPAQYYLDTIRIVFQQHLLPRGLWDVDGERVDPALIKDTALMTIEGELDDIAGQGQTRAAIDLCPGIPAAAKMHLLARGAGHYGLFSGRKWRTQTYPQVRDFIARNG